MASMNCSTVYILHGKYVISKLRFKLYNRLKKNLVYSYLTLMRNMFLWSLSTHSPLTLIRLESISTGRGKPEWNQSPCQERGRTQSGTEINGKYDI